MPFSALLVTFQRSGSGVCRELGLPLGPIAGSAFLLNFPFVYLNFNWFKKFKLRALTQHRQPPEASRPSDPALVFVDQYKAMITQPPYTMLSITGPFLSSQPIWRHVFGKVRFPKFGLEFRLAPPPPPPEFGPIWNVNISSMVGP